MKPLNPNAGKPEYDPAFFSEGYYGKGERGGFPSYDYHSDEQKFQLALKLEVCNHVPHDSALFVGCARGFEVAYWLANKTKAAYGVDVSEWAIQNQIPEAEQQCSFYKGERLFFDADMFDLVASYDVLTLLPDDMLEKLAAEMVRVAKNGIVIRVYVKNYRNLDSPIDGIDGATFKLRHFWQYDKLLTQSGKFKLDFVKIHGQYEATAIFQRV